MNKEEGNEKAESLLARLGYFLIASAFLIAAFIQLVTSNTGIKNLEVMINSVAALGTFIAAIYAFMNFWDAVPFKCLAKRLPLSNYTDKPVVHTWVIPSVFFVFWVVIWIINTHWYITTPFAILLLGSFFLYEICINKLIKYKDKNKGADVKSDPE